LPFDKPLLILAGMSPFQAGDGLPRLEFDGGRVFDDLTFLCVYSLYKLLCPLLYDRFHVRVPRQILDIQEALLAPSFVRTLTCIERPPGLMAGLTEKTFPLTAPP